MKYHEQSDDMQLKKKRIICECEGVGNLQQLQNMKMEMQWRSTQQV